MQPETDQAPGTKQKLKYRVEVKPRKRRLMPEHEIELPEIKDPSGGKPTPPNLWIILPTVLMSASLAALTFIRTPEQWFMALPMVLMALLIPFGQWMVFKSQGKKYKNTVKQLAEIFENDLSKCKTSFDVLSKEQTRILHRDFPSVKTLMKRVMGKEKELWWRRPDDDDFMALRFGLGALPINIKIKYPQYPKDDDRTAKIRLFKEDTEKIPDLPLTVNLRSLGSLGVTGESDEDAKDIGNTLILNIAVHHSPEDVEIYLVSHRHNAANVWGWMKWLPHTACLMDGGSNRKLSFSSETSEPLLESLTNILKHRWLQVSEHSSSGRDEVFDQPHLVIMVENAPEVRHSPAIGLILNHGTEINASAIFISSPIPRDCHSVIEIKSKEEVEYRETWAGQSDKPMVKGKPDFTVPEECEKLARAMSPLRLVSMWSAADMPTSVRLLDFLDGNQADQVDIGRLYEKHKRPEYMLDFPIGLSSSLKPVHMIMREAGKGGRGAHAMLAGMQGTGKSILLQGIVLSIAATHSPADVNILLADFKGGASELSKLRYLPHVVGFITDLNASLSERCRIALESEITRRKNILQRAGEALGKGKALPDIWAYNAICKGDPLPQLIVVLDEFAQGLKLNNLFRTTIDTIAAQGRALGMHLFLSTQRPADFDDKIRANIDYRLCLRVASREDSIALLKRSDAASIPQNRPGRAYLQVGDNEIFEQFQSARADLPYVPDSNSTEGNEAYRISEVYPDGRRLTLYTYQPQAVIGSVSAQGGDNVKESEKLVEHIIQYCRGRYKPQRQIYLDELPDGCDLPINRMIEETPVYQKWNGSGWGQSRNDAARLSIPIGMIDYPAEQEQRPWVLSLADKVNDGNFWVMGAPGSGRSTFLRSLISGLALTHSPSELHLYFLDFGQRSLKVFKDLPHCGGVFFPEERERVQRLFKFLRQEMNRRLNEYTAKSSRPSIVVVLDNALELKRNYEALLQDFVSMANDGKKVDIHFIVSSSLISDLPFNLPPSLNKRLGLRLNNLELYSDLFGRRPLSPPVKPGRGLIKSPNLVECQVAYPPVDDSGSMEEGIKEMVSRMADVPELGSGPYKIISLPEHLSLIDLFNNNRAFPENLAGLVTRPIAISFDDLQTQAINLESVGPFSLVIGPSYIGKTEFLVSLCLSVINKIPLKNLETYILDYRGGHLQLLANQPGIHYSDGSKSLEYLAHIAEMGLKRAELRKNQGANISVDKNELLGSRSLLIIDDMAALINDVANNKDLEKALKVLNSLHRIDRPLSWIACESADVSRAKNSTYEFIKFGFQDRSGIVLSVDNIAFDQLSLAIPLSMRTQHAVLPAGRGFLANRGKVQVVQFATIAPELTLLSNPNEFEKIYTDNFTKCNSND